MTKQSVQRSLIAHSKALWALIEDMLSVLVYFIFFSLQFFFPEFITENYMMSNVSDNSQPIPAKRSQRKLITFDKKSQTLKVFIKNAYVTYFLLSCFPPTYMKLFLYSSPKKNTLEK